MLISHCLLMMIFCVRLSVFLVEMLQQTPELKFNDISKSIASLFTNSPRYELIQKSKSAFIVKLNCGSLELYRFHKQKFCGKTEARIKEFAAIFNDLTDVVDRHQELQQHVSVSRNNSALCTQTTFGDPKHGTTISAAIRDRKSVV